MASRAGAKTKLTPKVRDKIISKLKLGNYARTAAACAGISESTFYHWLERGEKEKSGIYSEFLEAVKEAQAESEANLLNHISKAVLDGQWTAAAWQLERKFPERWGKQQKVELTGETTTTHALKDETVDMLMEKILLARKIKESEQVPQIED